MSYILQVVRQPGTVHPDAVFLQLIRAATTEYSLLPSCRYTSIVLLAISNFGYFYHGFSKEACLKYYLVAPAFKGKFF